MNLVDTHCHLLPGLDDGPLDERDALELARRLTADGVTRVVCTPHYSRRYPTDHAEAGRRLERMRELVGGAGMPLALELAAEVDPVNALVSDLDELAVRAIAGRFVLVEVLPDTPAPFLESALARLSERGLVPLFAHPERSRAVQRDPALLIDARQDGALVQIVAPSLIGRWGGAVEDTAWRLLDAGAVDLLASDAHGPRRRGVHLREAAAAVTQRLGPEAAPRLTVTAPTLVLEGIRP